MLHEGHTSGHIAATLDVSRNIVCGIRARAGGAVAFGHAARKKRAAVVTDKNGRAHVVCADRQASVKGGGKQLANIGPHDCRWPIGEPGRDGFRFCAQPRDGCGPYCASHRAAATTKAVSIYAGTAEAI